MCVPFLKPPPPPPSKTKRHYYGSTRSYCGQKVALSTTGDFTGEEYVVYDTGLGYGPIETAYGNNITFPVRQARYVRHWLARSSVGLGAHFIEVSEANGNALGKLIQTLQTRVSSKHFSFFLSFFLFASMTQ